MSYAEQNNQLFANYLNSTFFSSWKNIKDDTILKSAEFILNSKCDLACKYCYFNKHSKEYFPAGTEDSKSVLANTDAFLNFMWDNKFLLSIDLFGGEILSQSIGHEVLDRILSFVESGKRIVSRVIIPTNMNFLFNEDLTDSIESLIERGKKVNVPVLLSASVDGIFMEENRPPKTKSKKRNAEFYDKLFSFVKKYNFAFHPMVYSNQIEKWKDNFLWFQRQFEKYDINWKNIYLLEVRNQEWTVEQCIALKDFMEFLVHWLWNKSENDDDFIANILGKTFNILNNPFITIGRGLGCSIQSALQIRMGDLTIVPCHRLMYNFLEAGKFIVEDGNITGIEAMNFAALLGIHTTGFKTFAVCEVCPIKHLCTGGCLGAQLEATGDMFTPIPSMCRMEHYKIVGIMKGCKEIGMLGKLMSKISEEKQQAILLLNEEGLI